MKTTDFNKIITSVALAESFEKQFNMTVNLDNYSREELEDYRNKLRTNLFNMEHVSKINDLLTNETYQRDKALLQLLNTRIKEMLGEDIKQLRDKLVELSEGKKTKAKDKETDEGNAFGNAVRHTTPGEHIKVNGKDTGLVKKESASKCCCEKKGKSKCPVHGKKMDEGKCSECGMWESKCQCDNTKKPKMKESSKEHPKDCSCEKCLSMNEGKPSTGLTKAKKSAVVKKAKKGKKIGKGGFEKIASKAAKKYGSKEKGEKVAAAAMWKNIKREGVETFRHNVKFVNESIEFLLQEDEEGKAKAITAAGDIVNDFTSWMQRVGQYQTKAMIELADSIRANFGQRESETFKQAVAPALATSLETLTAQREAISNAVAVLAGEAASSIPMGAEPVAAPADLGPEFSEPGIEAGEPDGLNPEADDEFAASDAAAGAGTPGRELRESRTERRARKLSEAHSIMAKLAK